MPARLGGWQTLAWSLYRTSVLYIGHVLPPGTDNFYSKAQAWLPTKGSKLQTVSLYYQALTQHCAAMGAADSLDMDQNPYEVLQLDKEHESSEADIKKVQLAAHNGNHRLVWVLGVQ